jgi:hypothetical protein
VRYEIQAARALLRKLGNGPSPVSRWAPQAEVHVEEWAAEFGLIRSAAAWSRFRATAPGELAGRVYATAASQARLEAVTAWIGWLFLIDDQLDEGATGRHPALVRDRLRPFADMAREMAAGSVVRAAAGGPPRLRLRAALAQVWGAVAPAMPAAWRAAFARHYFDYLCGCEWEAENRARGRVPAEAEFAGMRRAAGAIWPSLDLLEYAAGAPLPGGLRDDPLLAAVRTACADVVCWTDDLLTVGKERAHGDVHNLVIVLEYATGCDERKAEDMVAQRIEARFADFRELRRRVLASDAGTGGALRTHVAGLHDWMLGHLEWGLRTVRYSAGRPESADYLEDLLG